MSIHSESSSLDDSIEPIISHNEESTTSNHNLNGKLIKYQSGSAKKHVQEFPPLFFSESLKPLPQRPASTIVLCAHEKTASNPLNESGGEYVSKDFINKFNERVGDQDNIKKARRLMKKIRILGGLHPSSEPDQIDIPAARFGFALLAGLNNHELKMEALDHLENLLEHDPVTEESSIRLISLTIELMTLLNRELIQTEILEVQIKSAKIYGLLAELIQRHYAKKHINAITEELKNQLLATARALRELNRLGDTRLDYYVENALEGIKRILDDNKPLFELIDRVYHIALMGASLYFQDLSIFPQLSERATSGIDLKLKFRWYDASLTLLKLGREAIYDENMLLVLQKFIHDNGRKLNWKFLYLAIEILSTIAINSPSAKIRSSAFTGNKIFPEFPGLVSLLNCSILGKKLSISPIKRFERPKFTNLDATIRLAAAKAVLKVSNYSPDFLMRKSARTAFLNLVNIERSRKVRDYIDNEFRRVQGRELQWINEEAPYNIYPLKRKVYDRSSLSPRRKEEPSQVFKCMIINNFPHDASSEFYQSEEVVVHSKGKGSTKNRIKLVDEEEADKSSKDLILSPPNYYKVDEDESSSDDSIS